MEIWEEFEVQVTATKFGFPLECSSLHVLRVDKNFYRFLRFRVKKCQNI